MKKTSILILCAFSLAACQSSNPPQPISAATTITAQSVEVSAQAANPAQTATPVAASAVAVAAPVATAQAERVASPAAVAASAPVAVVAKPKEPPVLSEAAAVALAKKRGCYGCHTVRAKVYGPAWVDVAAKYRGDAGAQAKLLEKVGKGGSGVWGKAVMPAQTQATADERAQLVRFILNLK